MAGGLIAYCILAALSSCKQKNDYAKEILQLDSTSHALNSAQLDFNKFAISDSGTVATGSDLTDETIKEITGHFPSDTVNKEIAMFLSELSSLKSSMRLLKETKHYYSQSFDASKKQLSHLKNDLEKDLIEKNKAQEYIVNEINTAKKIIAGSSNITEKTRIALRKLDSLKPRIVIITDSLRSK